MNNSRLAIGVSYKFARKQLAVVLEDSEGEHILAYINKRGERVLRDRLKVPEGQVLVVDIGDPLRIPTRKDGEG